MSSTLRVNELQNLNGTSAMTINTSGVITNATHVYGRGSHSTTISSGNYIEFDHTRNADGGVSFVDSNTAMQVPVGGLYIVGAHSLGNSTSGSFTLQFRKNGADLNPAGNYFQETASGNDVGSMTTVTVLDANDKVQFYVVAGASHGNPSYNNFFLVKVG